MKGRWKTWSLDGSASQVALKTVEINKQTDMWYYQNSFCFRDPRFFYTDDLSEPALMAVGNPIVFRVSQFDGITRDDLEKYGPKNTPRKDAEAPKKPKKGEETKTPWTKLRTGAPRGRK